MVTSGYARSSIDAVQEPGDAVQKPGIKMQNASPLVARIGAYGFLTLQITWY